MCTTIIKKLFYCLVIIATLPGCKKYLDKKSDSRLSTPGSLKDLQAIIDNYTANNQSFPMLNNGTDEYYLTPGNLNTLDPAARQSYIWESKTDASVDWTTIGYKTVFYANTVLDNLEKVDVKGKEDMAMSIKGAALFYRGFAFYNLSQIFAPPYDPATSKSDLGIPLRLNADFNEQSRRATVEETYKQVLDDLQSATTLLKNTPPPSEPLYKTRPTQTAALALLARIYLQMGNYTLALQNCQEALNLYDTLMIYKDATTFGGNTPFKVFNPEVILYTFTFGANNGYYFVSTVDTTLFASYSLNDLRRQAFFGKRSNGTYFFKGSYNGTRTNLFNGLTVDELYLIKAECQARLNNTTEAIAALNHLLERRWKANSFVAYQAADASEALGLILQERKKELVNRGIRWSDLRRLNKESQYAITLTRKLDDQVYQLPPNDLRYTYLIPEQVIVMSGIEQNKR
ncbi:RagB/SusD family nutrient uptake outer membrane protein [Pseudoflavitalea sp. X16]|uniref:RagB/SusD family nutrient uptake outer membrane protein n=1 Tax=Paraflavitalea devenefica TaxID=2716334 RepID=UPI0014238B59|nr:RagB/SusD family nutrient uptake outer membrane protein [Paraflavitalea devenefica]NII26718.1 RagB/SusD family nutrient uptake outer membrane protein [Paraflavitalea devenefica]